MSKYIKIIIMLLIIIVSKQAYGANDCPSWMGGYDITEVSGTLCNLYYNNSEYCSNGFVSHDLRGGIKEACHTGFPSASERMIIRRQGDTVDNVSYSVTRNYCWFRNMFDDWNCTAFGHSTWGDEFSATFALTDIYDISSDLGTKSLSNGRYDGHRVCVKRVPPGSGFATGTTNTTRRTKICAFVVNALVGNACNSYLLNAQYALIGCVDEPILPGPPTWNVVYNSGFAPYVDPEIKLNDHTNSNGINVMGYLSYGSTFDKPVVILTHGLGAGDQLILTYDYNIADKGCKTFPSGNNDTATYCAIPNASDPSQVCACLQGASCDSNSYIGCAPRPNLTQSNLKIIAKYQQYEQKSSDGSTIKSYPAISPQFVRTDTAGNALYKKDLSGNVLKDADGNSIYDTLPLPDPALKIREYYTIFAGSTGYYLRDSGSVYGVNFEAMIPKLDNNGKPIYVGLLTPYTRALTDGCIAIKLAYPTDTNVERFFMPDGTRERSYCTECPNACPIPSPGPCNDGNTQPNDLNALPIYCPGELSAIDFTTGGVNICLANATGWDFMTPHDQICVPIPASCGAIDFPTIGSGLAVWPELKPSDPVMNGVCDPGYGVVNRIDYSLSPMLSNSDFYNKYYGNNPGSIHDPNIYVGYQKDYAFAANTLASIALFEHSKNFNLSQADIAKVNSALGSYSSYHTIVEVSKPPTRSCSAASQSIVNNGCVNTWSCGAITKPSIKDGYANWSAINVDPDTLQVDTWSTFLAQGTCTAPYKQVDSNSPPQRYCVAQIDQNKNFVYYYWDGNITNPCVLQNP